MVRDCAINLDHLQTVAKGKLGPILATLSPLKWEEVRGALLFALGFR
jgi:mRNA interferase MazF